MQVDQDVGRRDQLVEDRARERVRVRPVVACRGSERLRFLPSSGTTNGDRRSNDCMLTTGTAVIEPASSSVSSSFMKRVTAAIEEYSQPWMPPISATCGPSCEPRASNAGCSTRRAARRERRSSGARSCGQPKWKRYWSWLQDAALYAVTLPGVQS